MSRKLGFYQDHEAKHDTEACPGERFGEKCLHCNKDWCRHDGWACLKGTQRVDPVDFDDAEKFARYLTPSMHLSRESALNPSFAYSYLYDVHTGKLLSLKDVRPQAASPIAATQSFTGPDLSDWKTWAMVPAGHCACNVPKHQCPTHK